ATLTTSRSADADSSPATISKNSSASPPSRTCLIRDTRQQLVGFAHLATQLGATASACVPPRLQLPRARRRRGHWPGRARSASSRGGNPARWACRLPRDARRPAPVPGREVHRGARVAALLQAEL